MSTWTERFAGHAVRSTLTQVQETLGRARGQVESSGEGTDAVQRIEQVVLEISRRLDGVDPNLVAPASVDSINSQLIQLQSHLTKVADSADSAALAAATTVIDALLPFLPALPVAQTPADITALGAAVVGFRTATSAHAAALSIELTALTSNLAAARLRLDELTNDLTNQKTRVDAFLSQGEQRLTAAESDRASRFETSQTAHNEQVQTAVRQIAEQAVTNEEKRTALFDAAMKRVEAAGEGYPLHGPV